jgi:protein subunit release factor A
MAEQPTCGYGIAAHAALPAKLGELTDAVAGSLEVHLPALDLKEENARKEHRVYLRLVRLHRQAAARLQVIGTEMAGQRDLPMGRHDQRAMASADVVKAFEQVVTAEQELLALLQERLEQDRRLLVEMRAAGGGT